MMIPIYNPYNLNIKVSAALKKEIKQQKKHKETCLKNRKKRKSKNKKK